MSVEKRIRGLSFSGGELVFGVRMLCDEVFLRLEKVAIDGNRGGEAVLYARHLEVRRVVKRGVREHRPRREGGQHLGEVERNLCGVIAVHRIDPRHVILAAPGSHIALVVFGEDVEPTTGHDCLDAGIENGQEQCVVPAERVADHTNGVGVHIRQRLKQIDAAPVVDDPLHGGAVVLQRVWVGLVLCCVQEGVIEDEANVAAFREFVGEGAIRGGGETRGRVLAGRRTSRQANHRGAAIFLARAVRHEQPARQAVAFFDDKRHVLPSVVAKLGRLARLHFQGQFRLLW